ncbi:hypothetical protein F4778DRAFT_690021 [Xylariomycetidae sp. FL2044]|nr:hypothetical protein F4778DRAFT_690021 [Xylariomycetidae sp. FL2044]
MAVRHVGIPTQWLRLRRFLGWGHDISQESEDARGLLEDDVLRLPPDSSSDTTSDDIPLKYSDSTLSDSPHEFMGLKRSRQPVAKRWLSRTLRTFCAIMVLVVLLLATVFLFVSPVSSRVYDGLLSCGNARYNVSHATCYNGNFLCPVIDHQRMLRCANDCFSPHDYSCEGGMLQQVHGTISKLKPPQLAVANDSCPVTYLHLDDAPYKNYFASDCGSANQVVVTSPLPDSDLADIGPRLLFAWPAGNSGIVTYFSPMNGENGSLAISLTNLPGTNDTLSTLPAGVTGVISLNSSAALDLSVIGSIRTMRNYVEKKSLAPQIQNAIQTQQLDDGGIMVHRMWLDNITETFLTFHSNTGEIITVQNGKAQFPEGDFIFNAWFNYPQLQQLSPVSLLNPESQYLISEDLENIESLSFLSYSSKVLAGAWRFLTYFGRDSLISLLLLRPILSEGEGRAVEGILAAAVERIDFENGTVCHEEIIGDYATFLNEQRGVYSSEAQCDYKMVDTDFFLPIALNQYFVNSTVGPARTGAFLAMNASVLGSSKGHTYDELIIANAAKVLNVTASFEQSPTRENLIHLKDGQSVGQWRDTTTGLAGGRIPYDVNTALVPAALRAISSLASNGFFASHPEWAQVASDRARVWEDETLSFFEINIAADEAASLVKGYANKSGFAGPVNTTNLTSPVKFYGLALDGNNNQPIVKIMNTDDCFRLFLLNPTNQTQLSSFLSQLADNIVRTFPLGLSTSVGLVVANPAYGGDSVNISDFTTGTYHGTVVWSWQLAMMAAGLEKQLRRCDTEELDFCTDATLHERVIKAYNHLWDVLENNREHLSSEVWSWIYRDGDFEYTSLGSVGVGKFISSAFLQADTLLT